MRDAAQESCDEINDRFALSFPARSFSHVAACVNKRDIQIQGTNINATL